MHLLPLMSGVILESGLRKLPNAIGANLSYLGKVLRVRLHISTNTNKIQQAMTFNMFRLESKA